MTKRKIIAALLAAVLCIASALPAVADDKTADTWYFGGSGQDVVYDATPLPNGNLLLEGYTQLGRNGREMVTGKPHQTRAWLVCLAPDGSILWEVTDETEGTTRYVSPVITSEGDIAVLFWNSPGQVTTELAIHVFGLDGVLKKKIPLPVDIRRETCRLAAGCRIGKILLGKKRLNRGLACLAVNVKIIPCKGIAKGIYLLCDAGKLVVFCNNTAPNERKSKQQCRRAED